jgi:hypothetical protein
MHQHGLDIVVEMMGGKDEPVAAWLSPEQGFKPAVAQGPGSGLYRQTMLRCVILRIELLNVKRLAISSRQTSHEFLVARALGPAQPEIRMGDAEIKTALVAAGSQYRGIQPPANGQEQPILFTEKLLLLYRFLKTKNQVFHGRYCVLMNRLR